MYVVRCAAVVSLIVQTMGCSANPTTSRLRYPATRTVDVVDDYHGTRVTDPYRWLEELESPEVRAWAAAQTVIAQPLLRQNDIRPQRIDGSSQNRCATPGGAPLKRMALAARV